MKNVTVNQETKIISFDITNLYTNVPITETLNIIKGKIDKQYNKEESRLIINMLRTIVEQNYFQFNNKIYKQQEGLARGSPLSAILSEIFLQHMEEKLIPQIMNKYNVKHWFRYVDNCLCIIDNGCNDVNSLHNFLNSANKNLKFTVEVE